MAQFEAVFSDGAIVTFEADSMTVDDGLVILEREGKKKTETVVVLNAMELLFIRDIDVDVAGLRDAQLRLAADDIHRGIDVLSWRAKPNPVGAKAPESNDVMRSSGLLGGSLLVVAAAAAVRRRRRSA